MFLRQAITGDLNFDYLSKRLKYVYVAATAFIMLFTGGWVIISLIIYKGMPYIDSTVYIINDTLINAMFLLYSVGFLFYGTRLFLILREKTPLATWSLVRLEVYTVILFLCFMCRTVFDSVWMYNVNSVQTWVAQLTVWYIPEIIPIILSIVVMNTKMVSERGFRQRDSLLVN